MAACGANSSTMPAADAAEIAGLVNPYFYHFPGKRGSFADFDTEGAGLTLLIIDPDGCDPRVSGCGDGHTFYSGRQL